MAPPLSSNASILIIHVGREFQDTTGDAAVAFPDRVSGVPRCDNSNPVSLTRDPRAVSIWATTMPPPEPKSRSASRAPARSSRASRAAPSIGSERAWRRGRRLGAGPGCAGLGLGLDGPDAGLGGFEAGTGELDRRRGLPIGDAGLGQALFLLVEQPRLHRRPVDQFLDTLELLGPILDGRLGLLRCGLRPVNLGQGGLALGPRDRAEPRGGGPAPPSGRFRPRRRATRHGRCRARLRPRGPPPWRRPARRARRRSSPPRALGGLRFPQSFHLLVDQPMLDGTPLGQLGHAFVLLLAVFPPGDGRGGLGFGLRSDGLGDLPLGPGDLEAGLVDLEVILNPGWWDLAPSWPSRTGPLGRRDQGRLLRDRLARDQSPGDDPGDAEGQQGEGPRQEPSAGWWTGRLHRDEPPSE